jgi:chromate reductase
MPSSPASSSPHTNGDALHVVGIAGSLRRESYNGALLRAARSLAPADLHVEIHDLAPLPLYNQDLDTPERRPEPVQQLKKAVSEADGLLLAMPEYNHGIPGVLMNAIDWLSRPAFHSPLAGRPAGVMGASLGSVGTARGQQVLRIVLSSTLAHLMPHTEVLVGKAHDKFDDEGALTDETTTVYVRKYVHDFAAYVRRMSPRRAPATA